MLSLIWPMVILAYGANGFENVGGLLLLVGLMMCMCTDAVIEAIIRRKRLLLPVLSLAPCVALFFGVPRHVRN